MRRVPVLLATLATLGVAAPHASGHIVAYYSLGKIAKESSNIVILEVVRINEQKNLVIYKKVRDLKGTLAAAEIKHNIGQRGESERDWKTVMAWAKVGKRAVFFAADGKSLTCIDGSWYQTFTEGEWWGLTHAEPYLQRSYSGSVKRLIPAVEELLQGKEPIIQARADAPYDRLESGDSKLQRIRVGLTRLDYDHKRDFVGEGGMESGGATPAEQAESLLASGSDGWRFLPAAQAATAGDRWRALDFDASSWTRGKAPIGYGEPEIAQRSGTTIKDRGQALLLRKSFDVPSELLARPGLTVRLRVASDDSAEVDLNGEALDRDPGADHEARYWNRDVEIPLGRLRPGRNVLAIRVLNTSKSSDLYLDLEVTAKTPASK